MTLAHQCFVLVGACETLCGHLLLCKPAEEGDFGYDGVVYYSTVRSWTDCPKCLAKLGPQSCSTEYVECNVKVTSCGRRPAKVDVRQQIRERAPELLAKMLERDTEAENLLEELHAEIQRRLEHILCENKDVASSLRTLVEDLKQHWIKE